MSLFGFVGSLLVFLEVNTCLFRKTFQSHTLHCILRFGFFSWKGFSLKVLSSRLVYTVLSRLMTSICPSMHKSMCLLHTYIYIYTYNHCYMFTAKFITGISTAILHYSELHHGFEFCLLTAVCSIVSNISVFFNVEISILLVRTELCLVLWC